METIDEQIIVGAIFRNNTVKPRWFIWNDRKYQIKEVTFNWKSRIGSDTISHFSVSDGKNLYEISLSQKYLSWKLEKVA